MSTADSTTSWHICNDSLSPESTASSPLSYGDHDDSDIPFHAHDNNVSRYTLRPNEAAVPPIEVMKRIGRPCFWEREVAQVSATRVATPTSAPAVAQCLTGIKPHELYHFKDGSIRFQVCSSVSCRSIAQAKLSDRRDLIQCSSSFL